MDKREKIFNLARTAMAIYLTLATQPRTDEECLETLHDWSNKPFKELVKTKEYNLIKNAYKNSPIEWIMKLCTQEAERIQTKGEE